MNKLWIFRNGYTITECTSFPFAFRAMYYTVKKALEAKKPLNEIIKTMSIKSPIKDIYGNFKVYSYEEANQMARNTGLLYADGAINSKEFKRF